MPWTYQDVAKRLESASSIRRLMNAWPPFFFTGIRVNELSDDFRHARVTLHKRRLTSNYVGTLYGGSLYSMTDPFWMVLVLHNLGDEYVVWDKAGQIDFISPGRRSVSTSFDLTEDVLDELRAATADGSKCLRWFENDIVDTEGTLVARARKQIYVRRRKVEA